MVLAAACLDTAMRRPSSEAVVAPSSTARRANSCAGRTPGRPRRSSSTTTSSTIEWKPLSSNSAKFAPADTAILVHGVAQTSVPDCTSPRRAAGLRERSQAIAASPSPWRAARSSAPPASPARRSARAGRAGGAVVVVAHQRHGAALARAGHHMLQMRALADHVPERPQLLHAGRLGRGRHRVKGFRMAVRVTEDRHDHARTLVRQTRLSCLVADHGGTKAGWHRCASREERQLKRRAPRATETRRWAGRPPAKVQLNNVFSRHGCRAGSAAWPESRQGALASPATAHPRAIKRGRRGEPEPAGARARRAAGQRRLPRPGSSTGSASSSSSARARSAGRSNIITARGRIRGSTPSSGRGCRPRSAASALRAHAARHRVRRHRRRRIRSSRYSSPASAPRARRRRLERGRASA